MTTTNTDRVYGKEIVKDFAVELERRDATKRDFLVSPTDPEFNFNTSGAMLNPHFSLRTNGKYEHFAVNGYCHGLIANRLGIPKAYYDKMREDAPELLEKNVMHWLRERKNKLMLRTLDGRARAFLSERYRPIDNMDLMNAVLPVLQEQNMAIQEGALTDRRLYVKALFPDISDVIPPPDGTHARVDDVVQAGLVISNSEVGAGSVKVEGFVWRLVCRNGLITGASLRKMHIGKALGSDGDSIEEYFRDATKDADDCAFMMKVQDIVRATMDRKLFDDEVNKIRVARGDDIAVGKSEQVIELTRERLRLTQDERDSALHHLIKEGDLSRWGVVNAITRTAQDADSYDRKVELERSASGIVELPKRDWTRMNQDN
jgi:hypothetical protein